MGKIKHNKLRNTGILFEILCKHMTHEILNPKHKQSAIKIIKKHFNKDSNLLAELKLYQQLCLVGVDVPVTELLNLSIKGKQRLDSKKIETEKYHLIKSIKESYDQDTFFKHRVSNYKLLASIYNVFEHQPQIDPTAYLQNKKTIIESLLTQPEKYTTEQSILSESRDVQKLTGQILLEKFNDKYKVLSNKQRTLLGKYVNSDVDSPEFKDYIITECNNISKKLTQSISKMTDPIKQIKLTEVNNLIQYIVTSDVIKDEHLNSMLKYYELLEEIK